MVESSRSRSADPSYRPDVLLADSGAASRTTGERATDVSVTVCLATSKQLEVMV
jgi:hypothetical protein